MPSYLRNAGRRWTFVAVPLAIAVLAACSSGSARQVNATVPRITTTSTTSSTTVAAQRLDGSGTAYLTHSGPSTFVLFGGTYRSPLLGRGKFHEDGTFTGNEKWTATGTMTAANGDALTFRSVGGVRSSTSTVAHSVTSETVIGGTGRFAGATGTWTTTADTVATTHGTLVLQTNTFRFTGTITLKN